MKGLWILALVALALPGCGMLDFMGHSFKTWGRMIHYAVDSRAMLSPEERAKLDNQLEKLKRRNPQVGATYWFYFITRPEELADKDTDKHTAVICTAEWNGIEFKICRLLRAEKHSFEEAVEVVHQYSGRPKSLIRELELVTEERRTLRQERNASDSSCTGCRR